MRWPWCWRAELEAAEARVFWTEAELRKSESKLAEQVAATSSLLAIAEQRVQEERNRAIAAEHKLFDRIVQMSGQPAIYEKPAEPVAAPAASTEAQPAPEKLTTYDNVHSWAREQMAGGKTPPRLRIA